MLTLQCTLPTPTVDDVASSKLVVSVTNPDGTALTPAEYTLPRVKDPADSTGKTYLPTLLTFAVEKQAVITTTQQDTDTSGNTDPNNVTTSGPFTANDNIAPPAPGQIGFTVIGETP